MTKKQLKKAKRSRQLARSKKKTAIFLILSLVLMTTAVSVVTTLPAPFHQREHIITLSMFLILLFGLLMMFRAGKHLDTYSKLRLGR